MKPGKIYALKNTINEKVYIGQTIQSLNKRYNEHICNGVTKIKRHPLYAAIRKYGKEAFYIELVENNIAIELLNERETFYIKKFDTVEKGYNLKYRETKIRSTVYEVEDIIKRYKSGDTLKEISKTYKCSKNTISSLLKENNVEIRNWNKEQSVPVSKKLLETLYLKERKSMRTIGKELGISATAIKNWFIKFGIETRPIGTNQTFSEMPLSSETKSNKIIPELNGKAETLIRTEG